MAEPNSHRQILRSSAIIGAASVVNILIGLLRMKVVAILLGPAGVGLIGLLQNLMVVAAKVSSLGFGNAGTRQIAEAMGKADQAAIDGARRALFWGTFCLAIVGAFLFWQLRHILVDRVLKIPEAPESIGLLCFGVGLSVAAGSQEALLRGMRRISDMAMLIMLSSLFSTISGIGLLFLLGEEAIVWFVITTPLATFILGHWFVSKLPRIESAPTKPAELVGQWSALTRLGFAFMVSGLTMTLGQLAVRTLVQRELGADSLGHFQAAWAISITYIGFVLNSMGADYYPRLTAVIHDRVSANRLVNEQAQVAILLAAPVLLAMLALSPGVIRLLFTEEFYPAVAILRWQILGDVLKVASWPMGIMLLSASKGKIFMAKEALVAAAFVLATWLLLPHFKLASTGIAYFLMYLLNFMLLVALTYLSTGFRWKIPILFDLLALAIAAIVVALLGSFNYLWGAAIGVLIALIFFLSSLVRLVNLSGSGGVVSALALKVIKLVEKVKSR